jgi:hypothetical protein
MKSIKRRNLAISGMLVGTAVLSTGCTTDEILTVIKIISWFI